MAASRHLNFLILFIMLLIFGMIFGNIVLTTMSLLPLTVALIGNLVAEPGDITVETARIPPKLQLGRRFSIVRTVTIRAGYGLVRLHQPLPEEFELVGGNNVQVVWKQRHPVKVTITCNLRCSKRGDYTIPQLEWAARHPLYLTADNGAAGESMDISVWPYLLKHREVPQLMNLALSPYPLADTSKIGVSGTDFREIRAYVSGDPARTINWKATAQRANPEYIWPLVNEFEKEGRKSTLLFMDASASIRIGSINRNVLEYSIEAASNLLYYFIDRGYRVGMSVTGERNLNFYPDSGRQQLTKIIPQLVRLKAGGDTSQMLYSIESFRHYISHHRPLTVVVASLDGSSGYVLDQFFERLKACYSRRRNAPIVLVNVVGRDLIPQTEDYESNLSLLMNLQSRPALMKLRKSGVIIIEWNPARQSFHAVLAARVRR